MIAIAQKGIGCAFLLLASVPIILVISLALFLGGTEMACLFLMILVMGTLGTACFIVKNARRMEKGE